MAKVQTCDRSHTSQRIARTKVQLSFHCLVWTPQVSRRKPSSLPEEEDILASASAVL